ncbi:unnamed protein product [Citrullus colocynthis]|uniref:Uncharacterized protein n=1 Tax=Citrullus colocynthis TaxID=252529 RepID=A0ABP0YGE6_9ROSI
MVRMWRKMREVAKRRVAEDAAGSSTEENAICVKNELMGSNAQHSLYWLSSPPCATVTSKNLRIQPIKVLHVANNASMSELGHQPFRSQYISWLATHQG